MLSVQPSIIESCANDLMWDDRAELKARYLCSISLAIVIDDHQPFCGLLIALRKDYNLSLSSLANITTLSPAQQPSNVIKVIQAVAVVTLKLAASRLGLRPPRVVIVMAWLTL